MDNKAEPSAPTFDTALLFAATVLLFSAMFGFYYFATQWVLPARLAILFAGVAASAALTYQTMSGKVLWGYLVGARSELRKVVWPTRQESVQTTLLIALVVIIAALCMAGLDWVLLKGVEQLTQRSA